jgi:hypothetical protein
LKLSGDIEKHRHHELPTIQSLKGKKNICFDDLTLSFDA